MREAPFECLVILDGLDEDQMQDMHCIPSEHMGPIRLKS